MPHSVPLSNALASLVGALDAAGVPHEHPSLMGFLTVWQAWLELPLTGNDIEEDFHFTAQAESSPYIEFGRFATVYIDDEYDRTEAIRCRFDLTGAETVPIAEVEFAEQDAKRYRDLLQSWLAVTDLSAIRVADYYAIQEVI